jgi:hypothetical protein
MSKDKIATALDFAHIDTEGRLSFQQPVTYSTWREGCDIGRSRAEQLIAYMRSEQDTVTLGWVAQSLGTANCDELDAIAVGFYQCVAEHLISMR